MRRREFIILAGAAAATWLPPTALRSEERVIKIVVLGDALASGYYLPVGRRFADRLEFALKAKGQSVTVVDASKSQDTAARGLARLNRSVPEDTDAVILELGSIDMLYGVEPTITRTFLAAILQNLKARRIAVLFCGAAPHTNLDDEHKTAFAAMFSDLASKYDVLFCPAFDDAFVNDAQLKEIGDFKPNAAGTEAVVARILPKVETLIDQARHRASGR
jgi:acyl-CoA thioesterase-1